MGTLTSLPALLQALGLQGYTLLPITYTPGVVGATTVPTPITVAPPAYPPAPPAPLPGHQAGTDYVPQTGPAIVHEGERIIPAVTNARIESVIAGMTGQVKSSTDTSFALRYSQEQQVHSMAMTRASTEMQVVKAQKETAQAQKENAQLDIQRLSILRNLVGDLRASGNGMLGGDIESLLTRLYGTRGRQGAGGFTKEGL
jgi:hypothetical protein